MGTDTNLSRTVARLTRIAGVALALAACSDMSQTQQRTLSGTAGGAAGGAVIGAIAGNAGMGAAIGAGVGLTGGMLYDYHKKTEERAYQRGVQEGQR
ncbi:YMGG-like glycine zipper-containing protein [Skermanella rosea]|uniref:glycine zipper family protein n=1 Tax=Skermanella rosea TaxID=1817965 RepID=UPI0019330901|nr:glycine zipper family protein [Skermanella rosea]UEM05791.1 YMGG-like glycine zipper-containing protein [Skermanella rosea]